MGTKTAKTAASAKTATATIDRATTIRANRPPAITWHRLKMNEVPVGLPAVTMPRTAAVTLQAPIGVHCLETRIISDGAQLYAGERYLEGTFDRAFAESDTAGTWETGMGPEAAAWLASAATRRIVVEVPVGCHPENALVVNINAQDDAVAVAAIDVVARANSSVRVVVQTDSPVQGSGVAGSIVRIVAQAGAHVRLSQLQTLDGTWKHLDDVGIFAADDARVDVDQTVLGDAESYLGFAADLSGFRSACDVDTHYLGHGAGKLDFNYVLRQRGRKTRGTLVANGVLTDESSKLLRGTIDLVHGAKGSVGREQETVTLANEQVRNKTIPVILCDEDDVQGDHGATIGHVNPEQLEYLQSRGLSVAQIESLFASAAFDSAIDRAFDAHARTAVNRLAQRVLGHPAGEDALDDAEGAVE